MRMITFMLVEIGFFRVFIAGYYDKFQSYLAQICGLFLNPFKLRLFLLDFPSTCLSYDKQKLGDKIKVFTINFRICCQKYSVLCLTSFGVHLNYEVAVDLFHFIRRSFC